MPFLSYAAVADVRDLGLSQAEADDPKVEKYLTRAERRIDHITRDRFLPETAITLRLKGDDAPILFLPRRVRSVTSVTVNGSALASTGYNVHSSLDAEGDWFSLEHDYDALERAGESAWPSALYSGAKPVVIVGNFSWAVTPEPVTEACALMAYRRIKQSGNKGVPGDVVRWTTETATFDRGSSHELRRSPTGWFDIDNLIERFIRTRLHAGV